jgi:hypothetical protein
MAQRTEPIHGCVLGCAGLNPCPCCVFVFCRPARGDWVGLVGETFGDAAVRAMAQRMRDSPTGRQILAERPRVTVSTCDLVLGSSHTAYNFRQHTM